VLRLTIDKRQATMNSLNVRAESMGPKEKRVAIDIGLSVGFASDVLDTFSPTLRDLMFDTQTQDLAGGAVVRFPALGDFHWEGEMTGATVAFDIGIGQPITFPDAKVNKFNLSPQEGGTVIVGLRAQVYPSDDQISKLANFIQQGVTLSITPMELPTMQEERPSTSPTKRGKKITKAEADEQLKAMAADGVTIAHVSPDGTERVLADGDALQAAVAAIAADVAALDPAHPDALQAAHDAKVAAIKAEDDALVLANTAVVDRTANLQASAVDKAAELQGRTR